MPEDRFTADQFTAAIRSAIADRAQLLALLVREMARTHPEVDFPAVVRRVTFDMGVRKALRAGPQPTPGAFLEAQRRVAGTLAFARELVEAGEERAVQAFHRCPLVDAWRELGASDAEVAELCALANPVDHGAVSVSPALTLRFTETIAEGGATCTMVVERRRE